MNYFKKTICPICKREIETNFYEACPYCKKEGIVTNYETIFDLTNAKLEKKENEKGIYKYSDFFPIKEGIEKISLSEGNTPLIKLDRLGKLLGIENLYIKDESKNPTYSHKDRMCSLMVTKAKSEKAKGLVIASTGNQGASVAAYSAVAGLPCVVFTTENVSDSMLTLMLSYGAKVFITPTMKDRVTMMEKLVREYNFFPASGLENPPIGSCCYAIDAYKTISYEVYEQLNNNVPDYFVIPISYGDTLYGIYKGMKELKEMKYIRNIPKIVGAEVFGALQESLKNNKPTHVNTSPSDQTSIAAGDVTYLTYKAVKNSNGFAEISSDEEALRMQKLLAKTEGIIAELSSVAGLVALEKMIKENKIKKDDKIVVLLTSTGIKTPEIIKKWTSKVPKIEVSIDDFKLKLKDNYNEILE